jgi:hypothetical protein
VTRIKRAARKRRFTRVPVLLILAVALVGLEDCSPTNSNAQSSEVHNNTEHETRATKAVADYVRKTRGWPDDTYTLQYKGRERTALIFWVLYKTDKAIPGGGGNSFEVLLNPETDEVERELRFQ